MKINIQNLSEGIYEFSEELSIEEIVFSEPVKISNKLKLNAFVDNFDDSYRVKLNVKTDIIFKCDRCLEDYQYEFDETIDQIYQIGEGEFKDDDIEILPKNTREIDLSKLINEVFLINSPIQKNCRDSCRGLCPNCGKNLNRTSCDCKYDSIDPRLEKLKSLIK